MDAWIGIVVVLAAAGALLGGLTLVRGRLPAELARKAAHVGTGLIALTFPLVFSSPWPVLLLLGAVMLVLLAIKRVPALRRTVGASIHGVERDSYGEFYLLASVAILFWSAGPTLLYAIPILIVTFADATAALVGVSYGRRKYDATEGTKTVEGSIAFFVVAFFATHVPLLLLTQTGRAESLLLALILGFLLLLFEGIAWQGLDNLFIPLSAYLILRGMLPLAWPQLAYVLVVVAAMGTFALVWRRRTTLNASALFGAVLVGFLLWALGGWTWLVPPVIVFAAYTWLPPRIDLDRMRVHNVHVVLSVTGAGVAWLFVGRLADAPAPFYLAFTTAFAAHLAMIGVVRFRYARPRMPAPALLAASVAQAGALILVPYWLLARDLLGAAVALAAVLLGAAAFYAVHYRHMIMPDPDLRWRREAVCAAGASALALVPLLW